MCFDHDGDWYVRFQTDEIVTLEKPSQCVECGRSIPAGEQVRHIYQQEHEECQCENCQDSFVGGFIVESCPNAKYGETYDCDTCLECNKLREAIRDFEEKEGCPPGSQEPSLGGIWEEALADYVYDAEKYVQHAIAKYPELASHRYVIDVLERDE